MKRLTHAKVHTLHIALIFLGAIAGGVLAIGLFVQYNPVIAEFDAAGYQLLTQMPHPVWLNAIVAPFNFNFLPNFEFLPGGWAQLPTYLQLMWILLLVYLISTKKRVMAFWAFLTILISMTFVLLLYELTHDFVFRERPFLHLPNTLDESLKSIWASYNSFPSGHSRDTAMYATIIAAYIPRLKWMMLALALFVAFSRVYLGAHYPTDVIVGVLLGYLVARAALMITGELQELAHKRRTSGAGPDTLEEHYETKTS